MKQIIKMTFIVTLIAFGVANATERDPFLPYTWSAPQGKESANSIASGRHVNPLVRKPLTSYTVIGVVVSPNDALAVIKGRDRSEYFAYIGDPIGSEGGMIETINTDGITVDISGKIVPLKISNRFESQDDIQTDTK